MLLCCTVLLLIITADCDMTEEHLDLLAKVLPKVALLNSLSLIGMLQEIQMKLFSHLKFRMQNLIRI